MDKFGYIRGKRGPPGPKGKDAIPLYSWFPDAMLQMFRQSERCTYYFNDALNFLGTDPLSLEYEYRDWNTMMIQYSNTENNDGQCFFVLNERKGFFIPHKTDAFDDEVYIGGKFERRKEC